MATNLIYGQEDRLMPWVAERIGLSGFRRDAYSIGLERGGIIVAAVVFDTFSDVDCMMHVAGDGSKRWMTKEFLIAAFAYPFLQLGLRRVTVMVPSKNREALEFDKHIGFKEEGYHPHAMKDDDLISMGMLRQHCRFIPKEQQA